MYDVVYLDDGRRSTVLASGLPGDAAAAIARDEAKSRYAARMFGIGSEPPCQGRIVLIVESEPAQAPFGSAAESAIPRRRR